MDMSWAEKVELVKAAYPNWGYYSRIYNYQQAVDEDIDCIGDIAHMLDKED